MKMMFNPSQIN